MKYIIYIFAIFSFTVHAASRDELDFQTLGLYLNRLELEADTICQNKDEELLGKLVKQHVIKIPFENLNMHTEPKTPILLDRTTLVSKLFGESYGKNRGGYCYELNELMYALLKTLGFDAQRHKASVWMGNDPNVIPWPCHQLNTVKLEDKLYLVDVGFGLFTLFEPVLLPEQLGEINDFVDSQGRNIRFEKVCFDESFGPEQEGHEGYIYSRYSTRTQRYERISTFSLIAYESSDYIEHNNYVQNQYKPFIDLVMYTRFNSSGKMITFAQERVGFNSISDIIDQINSENHDCVITVK